MKEDRDCMEAYRSRAKEAESISDGDTNVGAKHQQSDFPREKGDCTSDAEPNLVEDGPTNSSGSTEYAAPLKENNTDEASCKLKQFQFIKEWHAQPSQTRDEDTAKTWPNVKSDILRPLQGLSPTLVTLYSTQDYTEKFVYLVSLNDGNQFVLKVEVFPKTNGGKLDTLRRENYLGRTLGGSNDYICCTFDMKEIDVDNGKKQVEMLMQYGGIALSHIIKQLTEQDKCRIISQMSQALAFMEECGVVHMDIKLDNVVWNENTKQINFVDFGSSIAFIRAPHLIRQPLGENSDRLTSYTLRYSSPEIHQVERRVKNAKEIIPQAADVFCFGMTLLQILLEISDESLIKINGETSKHSELLQYARERLQPPNLAHWKGLVLDCLREQPTKRPTYKEIRDRVATIVSGTLGKTPLQNNISQPKQTDKECAARYYALDEPEIALGYHKRLFGTNLKILESPHMPANDITSNEEMFNNITLWHQFAVINFQLRYCDTALCLLEKEKNELQQKVGSKHPDLARVINEIGNVYLQLGSGEMALQQFTEAKNIFDACDSHRTMNLALLYGNMGSAYCKLGKYQQAIDMYHTALKAIVHHQGEDSFYQALVLHNIANVYIAWHEPEIAIEKCTKAINIIVDLSNEHNSDLVILYATIGQAYSATRNNDKAKTYYHKALRILLSHRGEDHLDAGILYNLLGYVCLEGDSKYALTCYETAERIAKMNKSQNNRGYETLLLYTAKGYYNLGYYKASLELSNEFTQGNAFAIECFKKAKSIVKSIQEDNTKFYLKICFWLGKVYRNQDQYNDALANYNEAEQALSAVDNKLQSWITLLFIYMGETYGYLPDYKLGLQSYQKERELVVNQMIENDINTTIVYLNIADTYNSLELPEKAKNYCLQAEPIMLHLLDKNDRKMSYLYSTLGDAYYKLGDHLKALVNYTIAQQIAETLLGNNKPLILILYMQIRACYCAIKNFSTDRLSDDIVAKILEEMEQRHPDTRALVNKSLGDLYFQWRQYQQAITYYQLFSQHLPLFTTVGKKLQASVLFCLGEAYMEEKAYQSANDEFWRANDILDQKLEDHMLHRVVLLLLVGLLQLRTRRKEEAAASVEYAIQCHRKGFPEGSKMEAALFADIAKMYAISGESNTDDAPHSHHKAINYNNKAISILSQCYPDSCPQIVICYIRIGFAYYALGYPSEGENNFAKADQIVQQNSWQDHPELEAILRRVSTFHKQHPKQPEQKLGEITQELRK